jgi:uncharacterized membrane protein YdjX (TVP38/TMEM64 family)
MKSMSPPPRPLGPLLLKLLLSLCAFILLCLIFYVYHVGAWRSLFHYYQYFFEGRRLKAFLASFGPYAAVTFVALQVVQVVVAPVPGEVTGFVGGVLFGKLSGTVLSTIGLTVGALIAFWVARYFGSTFVRKVVKKEYIDKFDSFATTDKGLNIAFLLFLIPGFPKDSLCYLLGLTRMRYIDFILMNVFGRLPGTVMLCMQGDAIRHGRYKAFWVLLAVSIALMACLYFSRNHLMRFLVRPKKSCVPDRKEHDEQREADPIVCENVE